VCNGLVSRHRGVTPEKLASAAETLRGHPLRACAITCGRRGHALHEGKQASHLEQRLPLSKLSCESGGEEAATRKATEREDTQTDRQTQTDRHRQTDTHRRTDRHTDIQTYRHTDGQTYTQTGTNTQTHTHIHYQFPLILWGNGGVGHGRASQVVTGCLPGGHGGVSLVVMGGSLWWSWGLPGGHRGVLLVVIGGSCWWSCAGVAGGLGVFLV
jgi:hypothetical protein